MDQENVVYMHGEILFSIKKEGNSIICNNIDEDIMINNLNQSQRYKCCMTVLM